MEANKIIAALLSIIDQASFNNMGREGAMQLTAITSTAQKYLEAEAKAAKARDEEIIQEELDIE